MWPPGRAPWAPCGREGPGLEEGQLLRSGVRGEEEPSTWACSPAALPGQDLLTVGPLSRPCASESHVRFCLNTALPSPALGG